MNENAKSTKKEKKSFFSRAKEVSTDLMAKLIVYLSENPGAIVPFLGIIGEIVGAGATIYAANTKRNKMCLSKDEISGEFYQLKHSLTNDEILELSSRMVDGDTKGEALETMGLLKNVKKK